MDYLRTEYVKKAKKQYYCDGCLLLINAFGKDNVKKELSPEDSLLGRSVRVFIDGKNVTDSFFDDDNTVLEVLAKKDGFDSVKKFFQWFSTDFKGKIIHWTDLKY